MDENHQNGTNNNPTTTENNIWQPSSSTKNDASASSEPTPTQKKSSSKWGFSGKTGWDWLNLLGIFLIPLMIGVFTITNNVQQNQISQQQYSNNQAITIDQQQETTLKNYLDDMKDLLLNHELGSYNSGDALRQVARVETLAALVRLDSRRKAILLNFLYQANLITFKVKPDQPDPLHPLDKEIIPILNLDQADLSAIDLNFDTLNNLVLLTGVSNFQVCTDFIYHNTKKHDNSFGLDIIGISLTKTNLNNAHMFNADLNFANLDGSSFENADLRFAHVNCGNLDDSDLRGANLSYADIGGTYLVGADLRGANLFKLRNATSEQLGEAASLKGAIMPDGSIHP